MHPLGPFHHDTHRATVPQQHAGWGGIHVDLPQPPDAPPNQLRDFASVLAARWRLLLGFTVAAALIGVIACVMIKPLYTATAVVKIDIQAPQVTTNIQDVAAQPTYF